MVTVAGRGGGRSPPGRSPPTLLPSTGPLSPPPESDGDLLPPYETVYLVNHSHTDLAWFDTIGECRRINVENLRRAVECLEADPEFRYSLENTWPLRELLADHPEFRDRVARLLREGRLEVGGMYVSLTPDVAGDEALVRNLHLGQGWLLREFGVATPVAKEEDVMGHTLQTPQLLARAGMGYLKISRAPPGPFRWAAPDGSRVAVASAEYRWGHYGGVGRAPPEALRRIPAELRRAWSKPGFRQPHLMIPVGDDCTPPVPGLVEVAREWNRSHPRPRVEVATVADYLRRVAGDSIPEYRGDIPSPMAMTASIRVEAFQAAAEARAALRAAETLGVIARHLGGPPPPVLEEEWRVLLQVLDHNWGGRRPEVGPPNDREKERWVRQALEGARRALSIATDFISKNLGGGPGVVVFNPLGHSRDEPVEAEVSFEPGRARALRVAGEPCELLEAERHPDGSLKRARVLFIAKGVPPLGYKLYPVEPAPDSAPSPAGRCEGDALDNGILRVRAGRRGISKIRRVDGTGPVLRGPRKVSLGNLLNPKAPAKGVRMKLLRALLGLLRLRLCPGEVWGFSARFKLPPPEFYETNPFAEGGEVTPEFSPRLLRVKGLRVAAREAGPVRVRMVLRGTIGGAPVEEEVILHRGLPRLDLRVTLHWKGRPKSVLLLAFPFGEPGGDVRVGVPFGVHRMGDEPPGFWTRDDEPVSVKGRGVHGWFDLSAPGGGVTVATPWPSWDFTLVPSAVLLGSDDRSLVFHGEEYLQKGAHSWAFSLHLHPGGWAESGAGRRGEEALHPLVPLFTAGASRSEAPGGTAGGPAGAGGKAPPEFSLLAVEGEAEVTSLRSSPGGGFAVRLYESAGKSQEVVLRFPREVAEARRADLLERPGEPLRVEGERVRFPLAPWEIATLLARLEGGAP